MKEFTRDELASFDGAGGRPAYVAFEGTVYDVSDSPMWSGGDHEGMHSAGVDLTEEHDDAPHGELVTGFPAVGTLA